MLKRVGVVCVLLAIGLAAVPVAGGAAEQPKTSLIAVNIFGPIFGLYEPVAQTQLAQQSD